VEILDAAHDCVMAVGIRRTTFSDVARRAGISRVTLYRRYDDLDAIIGALVARDLGTLELPSGRERLVEGALLVSQRLRTSPLMLRVIDVDPEYLMPHLLGTIGYTQKELIAGLEREARAGRKDGSIREIPPKVVASTLELATRSFVFSAAADAPSPKRMARELREMFDAYLRPNGAAPAAAPQSASDPARRKKKPPKKQ